MDVNGVYKPTDRYYEYGGPFQILEMIWWNFMVCPPRGLKKLLIDFDPARPGAGCESAIQQPAIPDIPRSSNLDIFPFCLPSGNFA